MGLTLVSKSGNVHFRIWFFCITVFCLCFLGMTQNVSAQGLLPENRDGAWQGMRCEAEGFTAPAMLVDASRATFSTAKEGNEFLISSEDGIRGIYIEFDRVPEVWEFTDLDARQRYWCGQNAFLHEWTDLCELTGGFPKNIRLTFPEGTVIADIYAFGTEEYPEYVQQWEPPCSEADILLVSSHSDDEQLFFAGLLPLYAGEKKMAVQVAYVVQHFEANGVLDHTRPHEQLDGLWTVGVRNYPVMSEFPDLYAQSKNPKIALADAVRVYENAGITYEDVKRYLVTCIRRFQPQVVISHDFNGEYGHGTHVLCATALQEAVQEAADETYDLSSVREYGTFNISKAYSHLYKENPISMNYDLPLQAFGQKTAFEVTQDGFACHKSQHWTWFYDWIYGTDGKPVMQASDIQTYSPCEFGLYYTTVGPDVTGGDFMENIVPYAEQKAALEKRHQAVEEWFASQRALALERKNILLKNEVE